jgi:hypothetical protein
MRSESEYEDIFAGAVRAYFQPDISRLGGHCRKPDACPVRKEFFAEA